MTITPLDILLFVIALIFALAARHGHYELRDERKSHERTRDSLKFAQEMWMKQNTRVEELEKRVKLQENAILFLTNTDDVGVESVNITVRYKVQS